MFLEHHAGFKAVLCTKQVCKRCVCVCIGLICILLISTNWPSTMMLGDDVTCLKVPSAKPNTPVCLPIGHLPNLAILNLPRGPLALHPCDNSSTSNCN